MARFWPKMMGMSRLFALSCWFVAGIKSENSEERLISTLLASYNKEIRPIRNVSQIIEVRFIMTLQQMISVIEKVRNNRKSQRIAARKFRGESFKSSNSLRFRHIIKIINHYQSVAKLGYVTL